MKRTVCERERGRDAALKRAQVGTGTITQRLPVQQGEISRYDREGERPQLEEQYTPGKVRTPRMGVQQPRIYLRAFEGQKKKGRSGLVEDRKAAVTWHLVHHFSLPANIRGTAEVLHGELPA